MNENEKLAELDFGNLISPEKNNFFCAQTEALIKACRDGEKSCTNIDSILPTMALIDAIYKSAELGCEVKVGE